VKKGGTEPHRGGAQVADVVPLQMDKIGAAPHLNNNNNNSNNNNNNNNNSNGASQDIKLELKGELPTVMDTKRPLGVGATATVWRGQWGDRGCVAIKAIHRNASMDEALRYPRSAEGIVQMHGVVVSERWIVLEYGDETVTTTMMKEWRVLDFVVSTMESVVSAMKSLSMAGLLHGGRLHGDLKLENLIYFKAARRVKVCDFSEACHEESPYLFSGTPGYIAPELLTGSKGETAAPSLVSGRKGVSMLTDVWSFGVMVWELLNWHITGSRKGPLQWYMEKSELLREALHGLNGDALKRALSEQQGDLGNWIISNSGPQLEGGESSPPSCFGC